MNKNLLFPCIVAALGGLLFGYDFVVAAGAKEFYEAYLGIQNNAWASGFAMSSAVLGCILGAVGFMWVPDRLGRRPSLVLASIFFMVYAILTAFTTSFWGFVGARILGGVGIGIASNASPLYIAEMSPADQRGKMVALNQFTIVLGICLAQFINWVIYKTVPDTSLNWRVMFGVAFVPALVFFILTRFIPESPMWLARKEQGIRTTEVVEGRWTGVWGAVALGIFLAILQQWCAINIVFNYAEVVFKSAGFNVSSTMFNQVIGGAVNIVFTILAMSLVDKVGRRPLMLFGCGGLAVIYAALGLCYNRGLTGVGVLVLVMAAIACFALTLGPVVWVVLSELFPIKVRGIAMSIAVAVLWVSCFSLELTFPPIKAKCGLDVTFWIYGAICLFGFAICAVFLHETKGKELD